MNGSSIPTSRLSMANMGQGRLSTMNTRQSLAPSSRSMGPGGMAGLVDGVGSMSVGMNMRMSMSGPNLARASGIGGR
jgi:hypothetical protein